MSPKRTATTTSGDSPPRTDTSRASPSSYETLRMLMEHMHAKMLEWTSRIEPDQKSCVGTPFVITLRPLPPPRHHRHTMATQTSTTGRRGPHPPTHGAVKDTLKTMSLWHAQSLSLAEPFDGESISRSFRMDAPFLYPCAEFKVCENGFLSLLSLKATSLLIPQLTLSSSGVSLNPRAQRCAYALLVQ
jgi:hypothetical protein